MAKVVRMYDSPHDFANVMRKRLEERLEMELWQDPDDPLHLGFAGGGEYRRETGSGNRSDKMSGKDSGESSGENRGKMSGNSSGERSSKMSANSSGERNSKTGKESSEGSDTSSKEVGGEIDGSKSVSENMSVRETASETYGNIFCETNRDRMFPISLHYAYQAYLNSGNFNIALHSLDDIVQKVIAACQEPRDLAMAKLDMSAIFPALRDSAYVEQSYSRAICEDALPGFKKVYLEASNGSSKIINEGILERNPGLTREWIERIAHLNLRSVGWTRPRLSIPSSTRQSCTIDVYMDNLVPVECQFLDPELTRIYLPDVYLISFPAQYTSIVMYSSEKMNTIDQAVRLAKRSGLVNIVHGSYYSTSSPNNRNIYWVYGGAVFLLKL